MSKTADLVRRARMELTLSQAVDDFCADKALNNLSPKTIAWYRWLLEKFIASLPEDRLPAFTLQAAREFIAGLQARNERYVDHPISPRKEGGLSAYTISAYVRALKAFSAWLEKEGYTKTDMLYRLKRPKLPEKVVDILSDEEMIRLVAVINPETNLGCRNLAILMILLDTGIRANELCTLTLERTNLQNGDIKVLGKGNKERLVPLGLGAQKALKTYLHKFRLRLEVESDYVFLSENNTPLTYNGLKLMINHLAEKAGIPRLHLHLCRHTFAVNYLVNGGELMTLKRILGHCSITTTQMYLNLKEAHVKEAHAKFSPVDRLNLGLGKRRGKGAK